jgi:hypothetical protein
MGLFMGTFTEAILPVDAVRRRKPGAPTMLHVAMAH